MSGKQSKALRVEAIERYQAGESTTAICRSVGKSRGWLYKCLQRKKEPYVPKGKAYPKPEAICANNIHQADLVGPRFIKYDGRFYCLNTMDIATHRIKLNPSRRKDDESMAEGLIHTWKELGIPDFLQMDNELSFRGSNRYPHSLGLVLRLCLLLKIQPMFIPQGEPWRNGEIERSQDTFDKAFFRSQKFLSFKELCLEVPESSQLPKEKIPIEDSYIHFFRFIRSDRQLYIFAEKSKVSKDIVYEYVKATICTDIHTLQVRHDDQLVQAFEYPLPTD